MSNRKPELTAAPSLAELIQSLEQATLMAKQIPITTSPNHLLLIYTSLHHAHRSLSSFISRFPPPTHAAGESSLSSAGAGDEKGDEPMTQVGEDDGEEGGCGVEEKMRELFVKNKRAKRRLSPPPASEAEESRFGEDGDGGGGGGAMGFDPLGRRLRALDLIYQFHS